MPQERKAQSRPITWAGVPTPEAREAARQYEWDMRRYWAGDEDGYTVPESALPDAERRGEP